MKRVVILLLVSSLLILSSCASPGTNPKGNGSGAVVGLSEGNAAPDFALKNIDGKDVKLSDYSGKIVVLNFFGVWCPWCIKEMPGFVNVYNDYKDKNVELVVVDVGDTKAKLSDYLQSSNFSIKPLIDGRQDAASQYNVNGYPTTYIIDSKGIIRKVHSGYMDEGALKSNLDSILNAK